MKANIKLRKPWSLLMGISLMAVLLSLTMLSKNASAYCDGWQRDICNHSTNPVTVSVFKVWAGGAWVNGGSNYTIAPGSCGYYSLHTGGDFNVGPIVFGDGYGEADLLIGTCTIKVLGNCGDGNPTLRHLSTLVSPESA
jgi:hypothetical protein